MRDLAWFDSTWDIDWDFIAKAGKTIVVYQGDGDWGVHEFITLGSFKETTLTPYLQAKLQYGNIMTFTPLVGGEG